MCECDGEYNDNCPPGSTRIFLSFVMGKITYRIRQEGFEDQHWNYTGFRKSGIKMLVDYLKPLKKQTVKFIKCFWAVCAVLGMQTEAFKGWGVWAGSALSEAKYQIPTPTCSQSALLKLYHKECLIFNFCKASLVCLLYPSPGMEGNKKYFNFSQAIPDKERRGGKALRKDILQKPKVHHSRLGGLQMGKTKNNNNNNKICVCYKHQNNFLHVILYLYQQHHQAST